MDYDRIPDEIPRHPGPWPVDPWRFAGALLLLASAWAVITGAIVAAQSL